MQQFVLTPENLKRRKKQNTFSLLITAVVTIGGLSIANYSEIKDIHIWPFLILIIGTAVGFIIYQAISKLKTFYANYKLIVFDEVILCEKPDAETVSLSFVDIGEILRNPDDSFSIKDNNFKTVITIPSEIDNYDELEEVLDRIKTISLQEPEPYNTKVLRITSTTVLLIAVTCFYWVKSSALVISSAPVMIGGLGWFFYKTQIDKEIEPKIKRNSWFLLFLILTTIVQVYRKLTT